MVFGAELFDKNNKFIKYYEVERKQYGKNNQVSHPIYALWKDNEDYFYLVDYAELPVVKKVKLEFIT